tara:strand:+ start:1190 stop:1576 length:387 start_codon:yes stop_codon:yes gene_type:complete
MATELTVSGTATPTLVGAWELRAGSHDTTEYLARGGTYPGNIDSFAPLNGDDSTSGDAANGYDPAPKMALITTTGAGTVVLAGGVSSILLATGNQTGGTQAALKIAVVSKTITITGAAEAHSLLVMYN